MSRARVLLLTMLAMIAFAGNSLLCRLALKQTEIDPTSFATLRLVSGAVVLWLIVQIRRGTLRAHGSWLSAAALFGYAIAFSFAYLSLSAATGALLLFGAVQATMIGYGRWRGERFSRVKLFGFLIALGGLLAFLLPGVSAPPLLGALLMLVAGMAWGMYSLRGQGQRDPVATTAGNFARAVPFTLVAMCVSGPWLQLDSPGITYAIISGALTSGIGYVLWYAALPALTATGAAIVQLSVPVLAAFCGVLFLAEPLTLRLIVASIAVLGGIALVVTDRSPVSVSAVATNPASSTRE